jgi:signal transduction histidine kinase
LITSYSVEEGLPGKTVNSLYRDDDGYLWCGTPSGLVLFNGIEFISVHGSTEKSTPSLSRPINGIIGSSDQKSIWVGTDSTIVQIDRSTLRLMRSFDVIKSQGIIESPLVANDTAVWVACSGHGLYQVRISDGKATRLTNTGYQPGLQVALYDNSIMCIADTTQQLVYYSIQTNVLWTVGLTEAIGKSELNGIGELENENKAVLLLTGSGLYRCEYASGTITPYILEGSVSADSSQEFVSMAFAPNGTMWLASSTHGIIQYNPLKRSASGCASYLGDTACEWSSGKPLSVISDQYGVIWCGTLENGLLKLVHNRYEPSVASGEFNRVCFREPVVKASLANAQNPDEVLSESMMRDYGAGPLSIQLWQTDFAFAEEATYNWQLEGSDEAESFSGPREVMIDPKDPGFYSFICSVKIPGCNNSITTKLFTVKIIPPFWMSGMFIGISVLTLILLVTLILFAYMRRKYKSRLRALRMQQELDKVRARISRDIHDEIGAGLTRIALSGELLSQKVSGDPQHQEKLKFIAGTARELSQNMKEVVWSVNPHYDSLDHMAAYFRAYVAGVAENADIKFRYVADSKFDAQEVNPETRRNLLLILKEAVSNAMKYSGCTELKLEIQWSGDLFTMRICDNGTGFNTESAEGVNSNGLRNMRQRAESSGGSVKINSGTGNGTCIEVVCPLIAKE